MLTHLRSNLVAYLALFVALGGTSYAAVTVTGAQVKDATLTGRDVRDGSLAVRDLNRRQLARAIAQAVPRQGGAGGSGAAGAGGAAGANGAAGERGAAGVQGAQGAQGAAGAPGAAGRDGAAGPQGAAGAEGAPGAKGEKGDRGEPGTIEAGGRGDGYATTRNCVWSPILSEELTITQPSRLLVSARGTVGSWSAISRAELRITVTRLSDGHQFNALQTVVPALAAESSTGISISGFAEEVGGAQAVLQPGTYRVATDGRVFFTRTCSAGDEAAFSGQHLSWVAVRA